MNAHPRPPSRPAKPIQLLPPRPQPTPIHDTAGLFTYFLYAGSSDLLVGIQRAFELSSDAMLRMARIYARGGNRVEVWHGDKKSGKLCHITY